MKKKATATICPSARKADMPKVIHPMLATLVDDPSTDPDWIFETKWDGFRSVCFVRNGKARFVPRNQIEVTPQYPELAEILRPSNFLKLSDHVQGEGEAFYREIAKFHLEGMIAKRIDSKYVPKRSSDWLKVKTVMRLEVAVGGYTQPRGTRSHFGSLV